MRKTVWLAIFALALGFASAAQAMTLRVAPLLGYNLVLNDIEQKDYNRGGFFFLSKAGVTIPGLEDLTAGLEIGYISLWGGKASQTYQVPDYTDPFNPTYRTETLTVEGSSWDVPIIFYGQYDFGSTTEPHFFGIGGLGFHMVGASSKTTQGGQTQTQTDGKTYFGLNLGAGYAFPIKPVVLEGTLVYHMVFSDKTTYMLNFGVGASYDILSFGPGKSKSSATKSKKKK